MNEHYFLHPQQSAQFAFGGLPPQSPNGGLQHDSCEVAPNQLNLHEKVRDTR
jgi:hypothetical protein